MAREDDADDRPVPCNWPIPGKQYGPLIGEWPQGDSSSIKGVADDPAASNIGGRDNEPGRITAGMSMPGEPLTAADEIEIQKDQARRADAERQQAQDLIWSQPVHLGWLSSPLAIASLVLIVALTFLFVSSQLLSALSALQTLDPWMRYTGRAVLATVVLAFVVSAGGLLASYFWLRPNRPLNLMRLTQLSERAHLRWLAREKSAEARTYLTSYLNAFPLKSDRDYKPFGAMGLSEDELRGLTLARRQLLNRDTGAGDNRWFDDFRSRFQRPLDDAAARRVKLYARRVAIVTAASPNALVDTLVTGSWGFALVRDLCRLYNLRAGRVGTTWILCHIFFNAYLAGQLNELEGTTGDEAQGILQELGTHFGWLAADAVAAKVLGKVAARGASATLNYVMLKRLGTFATRLLRPVNSD